MRKYIRSGLVRLLRWVCVTEYIGQEECPLMMRWEFLKIGPRERPWFKAMIHCFPPNVTDADPHDHPRDFITLILTGGYFNTEWENYGGKVVPTIEWLGRGELRFRRATHMHITETDERGAWTLVVMGPERRAWGFLRADVWWKWKEYVERFGGVIRCEEGVAHTITEGDLATNGDKSIPYRGYKQTPPPV